MKKTSKKEINFGEIQYENSPLVNYYFTSILKECVKLGNCTNDETVLDFGCGRQELKKFINARYVGYDIVEKLSDVKDYTSVKPDKIFAISVLEHLTIGELRKTLKNFKKMNSSVELVVSLPFDNWLSNTLAKFVGAEEAKNDHKIRWFQVYKELEKEFEKEKEKKLFGMTIISKWTAKKAGIEKE